MSIFSIAILGGNFDPIHIGHLRMAQEVAEELKFKKIIFLPCAQSIFCKEENLKANAIDRLAMIRLAIHGNSLFRVSDLEIFRGGKSYTLETLIEIKVQNPKANIYYLIGADVFFSLHFWYQSRLLFNLVNFIVVARPGVPDKDFNEYLKYYVDSSFILTEDHWLRLPNSSISGVRLIRTTLLDISSTNIKHRILAGLSLGYLVPKSVERYIIKKKLYGYNNKI